MITQEKGANLQGGRRSVMTTMEGKNPFASACTLHVAGRKIYCAAAASSHFQIHGITLNPFTTINLAIINNQINDLGNFSCPVAFSKAKNFPLTDVIIFASAAAVAIGNNNFLEKNPAPSSSIWRLIHCCIHRKQRSLWRSIFCVYVREK